MVEFYTKLHTNIMIMWFMIYMLMLPSVYLIKK